MRHKLLHKVERQMSRHHLFLALCLIGSIVFWYVGIMFYNQSKVILKNAREVYTTLNAQITEQKFVINELKTYCSKEPETINRALPQLPKQAE